MGFSSAQSSNRTRNASPAKVQYQWKGGKGELVSWDGKGNTPTALPATFAVLEQTRCIRGFAPMGDTSVRYFSNETVSYDGIINVKSARSKKGDDKAEIKDVISGKYSDIKDKLPQGARLACNLFVYNPVSKQIEVIILQGSSLGEFISFSKSNRIYENWVTISKGDEKVNGTVRFFPPKYELGPAYTDSELEELSKADQEVVAYQKLILNGGKGEEENVDQTPSVYEGEFSQEVVKPAAADNKKEDGVDFSSIPF